MQVLYENWLSADENWNKSKLVVSLQQSSKLSTFGCRKWFTRQDLIDKYKSPEIATEIIQEKLALEESVRKTVVRAHPDAPNNLQLQQYLCFDEDGESEQHDSVLSSLFKAVSKTKKGKKDKKDKDKDKKKRKRSSSSSSDSSGSESESGSGSGSSSDSSSDDKKKKKSKAKKLLSQVRRERRLLRLPRTRTKKKPRSRKKLARKRNRGKRNGKQKRQRTKFALKQQRQSFWVCFF